MKTIKIGNVEITEPVKCLTYQEAIKNCPKGFYVPKLSQLVSIMENSDYLLNWEKGEWIFFWSNTKSESGVQGLYRGRRGDWGASWGWGGLDDSSVVGRVVYVKNENRKEREEFTITPEIQKTYTINHRCRWCNKKNILDIPIPFKGEELAITPEKTYSINQNCKNCFENNILNIPFGTTSGQFKKEFRCSNCRCYL